MTENNDERAELGGHWEGLDKFLESATQPADDRSDAASGAAAPIDWRYSDEPSSWADAISSAYPIVPDPARRAAADQPDASPADPAVGDPSPADPAAWEPSGTDQRDAAAARADAAFEGFESWVPPWARTLPDLVIEPAASYPEEEKSLGRFAYADSDGEELPDPDAFEPGMSDAQLRGALEAILMVVNEPVSPVVLAQVLEEPTGRLENTLFAMQGEYAAQGRGFELRQVANGWRFYTRAQYASYVERFVLDGQQIRLTQAALETLAVVAYKQPVSRSRVAAIRGVNCDGVIKTLVTRGLVEECGTEPESGAHLYRTTTLFLEKVGINSVDELPSIAPFLPSDMDEFDLAQR